MTIVCGIDGCRNGWVVAAKSLDTGHITVQCAERLADLLCTTPALALAAVDIPIGLTDAGPRECDLAARRRLGPGRGSSVFPAPLRSLLAATSYEEACQLRMAVDGRKISKQTYFILPKIREVDDLLRSHRELQTRVHEAHPEVSFCILAGGHPMQHAKRTPQGKRERRDRLATLYGSGLTRALSQRRDLRCAEDDILDAFVVLWTAERIARSEAHTLPQPPPRDRYGLTMAITA